MPRRSGPWPRTSSGPIIAPSSRSCRRPPPRGRRRERPRHPPPPPCAGGTPGVPLPALRAGTSGERPDGHHRPPAGQGAPPCSSFSRERRVARAGRPPPAPQLALGGGGGQEPADLAGVTALLARSLPEGTAQRDAIAFVEATERLGAELHAEAGWETVAVTLEVPRRHFGPALALLAQLALQPGFPAHEVERLRDERLNDP